MAGQRQNLTPAPELDSAPASTTLEEQLERYQKHWSAVDFDRDDAETLAIRYGRRGPRGWWPLIAAAPCLAGAAVLPFVSPLGNTANTLIAAALVAAALVLAAAWRSCIQLRLSRSGLKSAAFPPLTGPSARVPLAAVRRFRVEKSGPKGNRKYAVNCLTRDGDELPLIRNIRIGNDAYLVSMLLIDRVKALR